MKTAGDMLSDSPSARIERASRAMRPRTDGEARSGEGFADAVALVQPRLHQAMAARYGPEIGHEAADEAVAWALANPARLANVDHLLAYLCRVGQSKARPSLRWLARRGGSLEHDRIVADEIAPINPDLIRALRSLSGDQRTAVMLVHAYGWTIAEVAAVRALPVTAVTNHLRRGLAKLRSTLKETDR